MKYILVFLSMFITIEPQIYPSSKMIVSRRDRREDMQKCSGQNCVKAEQCLHFQESKSKRQARGRWINADKCIQLMFSELKIEKKDG